ncbi:MAG: hypothetical protein OHK0046_05030 [Anaerolineae bacterium]
MDVLLLILWMVLRMSDSGALPLQADSCATDQAPTPLAHLNLELAELLLDYQQQDAALMLLDAMPQPDNAARLRRAQLYALAFNFDQAVAEIDTLIAQCPDDPALYVERGQIVILLYEWDRVLENYNRALALDQTYAEAYYQRGILYYSVLAREEALADFQHYLELSPEGDYAEAAQRYADSISLELQSLSP